MRTHTTRTLTAALAAMAGTLLAPASTASERSMQAADSARSADSASWTPGVGLPAEPDSRPAPRRVPRFGYAAFDRTHDGRLDLIEIDRVAGLGRVRFDVPGWGFAPPIPLGLEGVVGVVGGDQPAHGLGEAFVITSEGEDRRLHQVLFPTIETVVGLTSATLGYEPGYLVRQDPSGSPRELWVISRDWRHATVFRPDEGLSPIAELDAEPGASIGQAWGAFEGVLAEARGESGAEVADAAASLLPPRPTGDTVQDGLRWAEFEQSLCRRDMDLFGGAASLLDRLRAAVMCQRIYDAQLKTLLDQHAPPMQPNGLD